MTTLSDLSIEQTVELVLADVDSFSPRVQSKLKSIADNVRSLGEQAPWWSPETFQRSFRLALRQRDVAIEFQEQALPLLAQLDELGVHSADIWDLREKPGLGAPVEDLLVGELMRSSYPPLRDALVGVLTSKSVSSRVALPLIERLTHFQKVDEDSQDIRDGFVNVIAAHATRELVPDLIAIASNPKNGSARSLAIRALGRHRSDRAALVPVMMNFIQSSDRWLYLPAAEVLGRWRCTPAADRIEHLLSQAESKMHARGERTAEDVDILRVASRRLKVSPSQRTKASTA